MTENAFILCAFDMDSTQREQTQAFVKNHTANWWHQQPDVWIILSEEDLSFWFDHLVAIFHDSAKFFILALPEYGSRAYATKGYAEWLKDNYFEPEKRIDTGKYAFDEEPF